jgi:hypothetical protein
MRPGTILPLYVGGYFLGRLWIEALRTDEASEILGLRVNIWLSIIGIGASAVVLLVRGVRRRPDDSEEPYRDGHRWVDPRAEGAGESGEADVDAPASKDTGEAAGPDEADDTGEDGAEAAPDEAAVSDEPAEGPPPT